MMMAEKVGMFRLVALAASKEAVEKIFLGCS